MTEIIRRSDFVGGGITEEERKKLNEHTKLWIDRILRTDPIEESEIISAIQSLYAVARLPSPKVIIVPSPLVMAVAGSLAKAIWDSRNGFIDTSNATDNATLAATSNATRNAELDDQKCWIGLLMHEIATTYEIPRKYISACVNDWINDSQGGNMWGQYDCYLTAARDILGLRLPQHEAYAAWEQCAIHGGYRYMHREFCLVSDFPEFIRQDEQHRAHCADGPSHRWRDGWELFHWHGVSVPQEWIMGPKPTPKEILSEPNLEKRRAGIEILGWDKILSELDTKILDEDPNPLIGTLLSVDLPEARDSRFLKVRCGTGRDFVLSVPQEVKTAAQANAWTYGISERDLRAMQIRT